MAIWKHSSAGVDVYTAEARCCEGVAADCRGGRYQADISMGKQGVEEDNEVGERFGRFE